jgi:hypothetical protein
MEAEARAEAERASLEARARNVPAPISVRPPRRESGWSTADFAVMAAALSLLVLSVVGLFWLLKG